MCFKLRWWWLLSNKWCSKIHIDHNLIQIIVVEGLQCVETIEASRLEEEEAQCQEVPDNIKEQAITKMQIKTLKLKAKKVTPK